MVCIWVERCRRSFARDVLEIRILACCVSPRLQPFQVGFRGKRPSRLDNEDQNAAVMGAPDDRGSSDAEVRRDHCTEPGRGEDVARPLQPALSAKPPVAVFKPGGARGEN